MKHGVSYEVFLRYPGLTVLGFTAINIWLTYTHHSFATCTFTQLYLQLWIEILVRYESLCTTEIQYKNLLCLTIMIKWIVLEFITTIVWYISYSTLAHCSRIKVFCISSSFLKFLAVSLTVHDEVGKSTNT